MLHIVDGDAGLEILKRAQIPGRFLSWLDVLHDGPMPAELVLEDRALVRASFIAACGWETMQEAREKFSQRNQSFAKARHDEPLTLWFNAEMFDQLQLLEILENLHYHQRFEDVFLVQTPQSITMMSREAITELYQNRQPLHRQDLASAKQVWDAFTADTPEALATCAAEPHAGFPFLKDAIKRFCLEFPSLENGLSQTEQRTLEMIAEGVHGVVDLFRTNCRRETVPYMGDASYWLRLADLTTQPHALACCESGEAFFQPHNHPPEKSFRNQRLNLTRDGEATLQAKQDCIKLRGIDHWLGGVHLQGKACWRYDGNQFVWA